MYCESRNEDVHNVTHRLVKAHVKVVASPKDKDSTTVDTRPTTMTKRLPRRSEITPQKCAEQQWPIIKADESKPA